MDSLHISSSPFLVLLMFVFLVLIKIPVCLCNYDWYSSCSNEFKCGKISVGYPFWGNDRPKDCGYPGLKLNCDKDIATIAIMNLNYRVLDVNPVDRVLKIARDDYMDNICPEQFVNTTRDSELFDYDDARYTNLTIFYGCKSFAVPLLGKFSCPINGVPYDGYMLAGTFVPGECNVSVVVPIPTHLALIGILSKMEQTIREGFEVTWKVKSAALCRECTESRGVCGFNLTLKETTCFCQNQNFGSKTCPSSPATPVGFCLEEADGAVVGVAILTFAGSVVEARFSDGTSFFSTVNKFLVGVGWSCSIDGSSSNNFETNKSFLPKSCLELLKWS